MSSLKHRSLEAEQLDNLQVAGSELRRTLMELKRINRLVGNTAAICKAVLRIARQEDRKTLRIVDLGCGGGDILLAVAKTLEYAGIKADLIGFEGNPNSVQFANEAAAGRTDIQFQHADILAPDFLCPPCDLVISSHFLYHLDDESLIQFFHRQQPRVRTAWILGELQRSMFAHILFRLVSPLLNLSHLSRKDGLLAIQRAFRREELVHIFQQCPFSHYSIKWIWSFRYVITLYSPTHA